MPGPTRSQKAHNSKEKAHRTRKTAAQTKASKGSTTQDAPYNLEALEKMRDEGKEQYSLSQNTKIAYAGQLRRARAWLSVVVKVRREALARGQPDQAWTHIDNDELEKAFEDAPNRFSAYALELLLTEKCLGEGLSVSTAQSMYSALKNLWENM